jgi:hypothetical protein
MAASVSSNSRHCVKHHPELCKASPGTVSTRNSRVFTHFGRAGGDRTHDRGIMRWEQTVEVVRWRRIHPSITHCPVASVWSGGVGLVCGMNRGIIEAATEHRKGSIRSAGVNNSNLRIEPRPRNRDRRGNRGRLSDLISPSPSSVMANQWEEPNVRKHRAHR